LRIIIAIDFLRFSFSPFSLDISHYFVIDYFDSFHFQLSLPFTFIIFVPLRHYIIFISFHIIFISHY